MNCYGILVLKSNERNWQQEHDEYKYNLNETSDIFFIALFVVVTMAARATKDWRLDCKVYIGDLGYGAAKQEIEDVFQRYGPLRNVWVARNPPGFAFVEFQDPRDAEDATKALDGT